MNNTDLSAVGRRSKRKGKKYESRVASILSKFTGVNFRRVPMSGGFNKFGGVVVAEHVFSGDVLCDNKSFLYSVEAKNREDVSLTALLKNPESASLTKYWYQCCEDAAVNHRKPIMFFKPNVNDDWVAVCIYDVEALSLQNSSHIIVNIYHAPVMLSIINRDSKGKKLSKEVKEVNMQNFVVLEWNQFIKIVNPQALFGEKI
jgi:hypothetical protein